MGKKILIVDDEKTIVDILSFNLRREGYEITCAYDGGEGLEKALGENPDLVLLDIMLPVMDGFEVCREIRKKSNVPIIMLTAREEENDKVLGLEIGADDYITKPFSVKELAARVKSNIRRNSVMLPPEERADAQDGTVIRVSDLEIDTTRMEIYKNGERLDLTLREYELVKYLASQPGRVCSREELMRDIWNYDYYGDLRAVDVAVRRLREKIEDNSAEPKYIVTRRGAGYYFAG